MVLLFAFALSSEPVTAATVKTVHSGVVSSGGNGTVTASIPAVDTTKSFLMFQTRSNSNRPPGSFLRGRIANATTVEFVRSTNESSTIDIQWYVVEYSSGARVQRGAVSQSATTVDVTLGTPVASKAQAFLLWSKTPASTDSIWSQDDPVAGRLLDTTTLRFTSGGANGNHVIWWEVVEYTNPADITVQEGTTSMTGSVTVRTVNLGTPIDPGTSFLLVGFSTSADGADVNERMVHARIVDTNTIEIRRDAGGDGLNAIYWQVVDLKDGSSVQSGTTSLATGNATTTVGISSVNTSRAIAFASVQPVGGASMGSTDYAVDDLIGVGSVTIARSATQVTLQRNSTVAGAEVGWFVVEFNGPSGPVGEYRFDALGWSGVSGEVVDDSGNAYNGTAFNASTTPGLLCRSASLSTTGTSDYLSLDHQVLDGLSDFTIAVWGKTSSSLAFSTLVSGAGGNTGTLANELVMLFRDANEFIPEISVEFFDDTPSITVSTNVNDGQWRHYAWTRTAATRQSCLYMDGVLQGCVTNPDSADDGDPVDVVAGGVIIGQDQDSVGGSFDSSQAWNGELDELLVFSTVLSAAQIGAIRTNHLAGLGWDGSVRDCPAPTASTLYLSTTGDAAIGGLSFADEDLVQYDPVTGSASMVVDGSAVWGGTDLDAVHVLENGHVQFSLESTDSIGGLSFNDEDVVDYDPSTGAVSLVLDGSTVFSGNEDVDGFYALANGHFLLSTKDSAAIGGLSFEDEDVVDYDPVSGTATLFFEGDNVFASDEDVDGIHVLANGDLLLSTTGDATIGGITVDDEDVVQYNLGTGVATRYFDGDAVYSAEEDTDAISVLEPATSSLDHFSLDHDGAAINCQIEPVTISAHQTDHSVHTAYAGTITLSTSTNHGDWSVLGGNGALSNSGSGGATYTFAAADNGQVSLGLRNTYSETVNINVSDGSGAESPSEDPDLAFAATGFNFLANGLKNAIGTQIAAKGSNVVPGVQSLEIEAVETVPDTGACQAALVGTVSVELAFECDDPANCAGALASINATLVAANNAGSVTSYTPLGLDFGDGTDSTASFVLSYPDAGRIRVHARYNLPGEDGSPSGNMMVGASNGVVVRPFGFDVDFANDRQNNGTGGASYAADGSGSRFRKAGESFDATITAVAWAAADDADGDGHPDANATLSDNPATENFGQESSPATVNLTHSLVAPPGGVAGGLTGSGVGGFVTGTATGALTWSEVGIIDLDATHSDYLGSGVNVTGRVANVGRFFPARFALTHSDFELRDGPDTGWSCSFTYMDQDFSYGAVAPTVVLTAQSLNGNTTLNYGSDFWKFSYGIYLANRSYVNDATTSALLSAPAGGSVSLSGEGDFDGQGTLTLSGELFRYLRPTAAADPFSAQLSVTLAGADLVDGDGVCYDSVAASCNVGEGDSAGSYVISAITGTTLRFGRLRLENVAGSELLSAALPMTAQYYNGLGFVTNAADSCSNLPRSALDLANDVADPPQGTPTIAVGGGNSTASFANVPVSAGVVDASLSPPGAGNTGYAEVRYELGASGALSSWLQYDWDGDGAHDDNPNARVTFGVYEGAPAVIHLREPWD